MSRNLSNEHRVPEYSLQAEEAWARHSGKKNRANSPALLGPHCQGQIMEDASDNSCPC